MSVPLEYLTAREAVDLFASRQLSPVELMQALLARAERLCGSINATTAIHAEAALAQARLAEARYRAGTQRPLEGVPVAIKEETSVAGWSRTIGSWLHDEVAAENHPIVDKLLQAGAIPHLQTTVPEFCLIGQTWSSRSNSLLEKADQRQTSPPGLRFFGGGRFVAFAFPARATHHATDVLIAIRTPQF